MTIDTHHHNDEAEIERLHYNDEQTCSGLPLADWHMAYIPELQAIIAIGFEFEVDGSRHLTVTSAIREADVAFQLLLDVNMSYVHLLGNGMTPDAAREYLEFIGYPNARPITLMETVLQLYPVAGWAN